MPLQNDPRIYSGGNVKLEYAPHNEQFIKLMQQERAKEDAFDEYVRNLNMKINPAGLRNNERPVFEDKLKKWQDFAIQNKEALRNPRKDAGRASLEFQAGYQDLQNLISRSKGVEELKKPGVEVTTDPNKFDRVNKDKLMQGFHETDQDLYIKDPKTGQWVDNPDWKPFNPANHIEFDDKPYDQTRLDTLTKPVIRQQLAPTVVKNPNDMTQTVTTTAVFDKEGKDKIGEIAVTEYGTQRGFKKIIDSLDPAEYNDFYKQNYGHDIQNKGDLAAAYLLKRQQQKVTTQKLENDTLQRQLYLKNYEHSLKAGDDEKAGLWIDKYVADITQGAKNSGKEFTYKLADGKTIDGYKVQLDPTLSKALGFDGKNPGTLIATNDGDYIVAPYRTDDKYMPIVQNGSNAIATEMASRISPDQLKLALGKTAGVKQLNQEMSAGKQPTKPEVKKEIKRSQISAKAAAANYSVAEYEKLLKQNGIKIVD